MKNKINIGRVYFYSDNEVHVGDKTQEYEEQREKYLEEQQVKKEQKYITKQVNEIFEGIVKEFKEAKKDDQSFDFSNVNEAETDRLFDFKGSAQKENHNIDIEEVKEFDFGNTQSTQAFTPTKPGQGDKHENSNEISKNLMQNFNMLEKENDTHKEELDEEIVSYIEEITKGAINKTLKNIDEEDDETEGDIFFDTLNVAEGTEREETETFYNCEDNNWKAYIDHNKNNNPTFDKVLDNLVALSKGENKSQKLNITSFGLNKKGELEDSYSQIKPLDIYNEKLWAGGRFLLRFDTPDGADKFLASIDTSALYRREAATHGSEYDGKFLIEKKESNTSAVLKGLFYGTHYGVDIENPNSGDGQSPGHLYINKENHILQYYASKIPFIGSEFEKNHYSEIQIGIENHPAPGVFGVFLDKTGIKKAEHSTSGESDGINPIGNAKNIYKVKLDEDNNIENKDGLKNYLEKAGVTDVENLSIQSDNWEKLNENDEDNLYKYQITIKGQVLHFIKDSKGNVFVANPQTLNDGENVIFDINGKTIDVDAKKVNQIKPVQEDSLTLKDTRDILHSVIIAPKAYNLVKDITKNVVDPLPKVFGFNPISDYIPDEAKHYSNMVDEYAVDYGNMALDKFNYGFNTIIEKPIEYIKLVNNYLGEYPSSIVSMPYEFIIKPIIEKPIEYIKFVDNYLYEWPSFIVNMPYEFIIKPMASAMTSDNLNITFNALNFYLDGHSVFINPFISVITGFVDNLVEKIAPNDESYTAYNYAYTYFSPACYAGYSFGKHYMLHANNTGLHKTTYSSEKFTNAIGKTIGDVNSINNIEKDIQDQDVGYATYIADAGVVYGLLGNSTMPTDKKWLPVEVATSIISFTPKMFTFYSAHNALKYIDNKIGISTGSAKLLSYINPFSYSSVEKDESVIDNRDNFVEENMPLQDDDVKNKIDIQQIEVDIYNENNSMVLQNINVDVLEQIHFQEIVNRTVETIASYPDVFNDDNAEKIKNDYYILHNETNYTQEEELDAILCIDHGICE